MVCLGKVVSSNQYCSLLVTISSKLICESYSGRVFAGALARHGFFGVHGGVRMHDTWDLLQVLQKAVWQAFFSWDGDSALRGRQGEHDPQWDCPRDLHV